MKVLITGSQGQLGQCLVKAFSTHKDVTVITCNKQQLDISNEQAVFDKLIDCNPDIIINTAAYTAVDNAEKESELAFSINALAPKYLSRLMQHLYIFQRIMFLMVKSHRRIRKPMPPTHKVFMAQVNWPVK
jgi:dTDP-4-dehydrorhamnose reductase